MANNNVCVNYLWVIVLSFLNIFFSQLYAVTIGSDTAPSRISTQQALGNGDRVAGFAALEGGFFLSTNSTATWDTFFPASGNIAFSAGSTLLLNLDLLFADQCRVSTFGNINGQGHYVDLSSTITFFTTSQSVTFSNVNLVMNNDLALNNARITFLGNSEINGRGCSLDLRSTSSIIVGANSRLLFKDIVVGGVTGRNIQGLATTSRITFQDTIVQLSANYVFAVGRFDVVGIFKIMGNKYFTYATDQVSTVSAYSSLMLDTGVTFSYAPSTNTRFNLLFENSQAQLILNSATFSTSTTGITFRKGTIGIEGKSFFTPSNSTKAGSIALGDGANLINDSVLHIYPGATLVVTNGFLEDNNV